MKNFILLFCSLILGAAILAPSAQAESRNPVKEEGHYCPANRDQPNAGTTDGNRPLKCVPQEEFNYTQCASAKRELQSFLSAVQFDKNGENSRKILADIGSITARLNVACAFRPKVTQPYECSIRSTDGIMVCKGTDPKGPNQPDYTCKQVAERSDGLRTYECKSNKHKPYVCERRGRDDRALICTGTDPKGPGIDVAPRHTCKKIKSNGERLIWACKRTVSCVPGPNNKCPNPEMPEPYPPSCTTENGVTRCP